MVNYTGILESLGNASAKVSGKVVYKTSELSGSSFSAFSQKVLAIFILLVIIFLASKMSNKVLKIAIIVVGIILVISLIFSFFSSLLI